MRKETASRSRAVAMAAALALGLLIGCDATQETAAERDAEGGHTDGQTREVSSRLHETEAAAGMSRQASQSYLGATMRARARATDVLGRADATREEQVREEREFDAPRRD
jgi:hypothetical protein